MSEKTMDELEAELVSLRKANKEREIAEERKKLDEAEALEKEKLKEKEIAEMRSNILVELGEKSKVVTSDKQKATLEKHEKATVFSQAYVERHGVTGLGYKALIEELCDGKGKQGILRDIENREKTGVRY